MSNSIEIAGAEVGHPDEVYVGGEWLPASGGRYEIVSPADEKVVAEVGLPGTDQAEAAVSAAHERGLTSWARLPVADRVEAVRRFCAAMEERLPEMGAVWAVEAGMPVRYSATLHRFGAVGAWTAALDQAEDALRPERRSTPLGDVLVKHEPAGVVAGIMAYNGPLVTMATKIIPALLAGCPVIVKAAVESQLIMRLVAECAEAAGFPPGTLSILAGDTDVARALSADPRVDLVSLTGGRVAAQDIIESTRGRFARTHLELGGKSPALILPDAPLDKVLRSLVPGATGGTGQVCALLTRVLVPESRHDEVVDAMTAAWSRLKIGDPLDRGTDIGPLANAAALARTERAVERAVAEGGRVVAGGERPPGPGWWFEPAIVTDVQRGSDLARNEVFGPVTAVLTYTDLDDGIALANDTSYGLAATVYTTDLERGQYCADRITAGSVALNSFGPSVAAPWGGRKGSGWGREGGPEGIREFAETKQILLGPGLS
ncbi:MULTISPECIES: aldehyde dehydrogenase family protein [unclassified Amycolatopsis]|uniref:aldehyde dehydrogenase family protein n=1 Tax=unclassified Amycolatopsis TaxID=2618356 RepID=UPI00143210B2|nr:MULTISPECIES: aldehyde dehydrogenase family protein [unclassified Amycolatopsis]